MSAALTQEQQEELYQKWSVMKKRDLLKLAQEKAAQHKVRGCKPSDSTFQIMVFLMLVANREAAGETVAC